MGTRHLVCVYLDEQFKIAQYGQWDGNPGGQGATVLNFCRNLSQNSWETFEKKVRALKTVDDAFVEKLWKEAGAVNDSATLEVSRAFKRDHPGLHRDTCADILDLVHRNLVTQVRLSVDFAADSLFCEWSYVIDMDAGALEVYRGFQKEPHREGKFAKLQVDEETRKRRGSDIYYPVKRIASFPLELLPSTKDFVEKCDPPEEEE